jgi:hypothetical protein
LSIVKVSLDARPLSTPVSGVGRLIAETLIHFPDKEKFIKYMTENNIEVSPVHNRNDNYTIFKKFKTELPNLDNFFSKQIRGSVLG